MSRLLNHAIVTAAGEKPDGWVYFLHGIYGRGGNLRTLAKNFVRECPSIGVVLVDLRMHGKSTGFDEPHDLESAANDVILLIKAKHDKKNIVGIVGHSFGGKVALECNRLWGEGSIKVVVLDSTPSKNPAHMQKLDHTVIRFLNDLKNMPPNFQSREHFVDWMSEKNYAPGVIQWLAMNLNGDGDTFSFSLEYEAMNSLLTSYFDRDLWDQVGEDTFLMVAGKHSSVTQIDLEKYKERLPGRVSTAEESSHWLHVEAPKEVLNFLKEVFC